MPLNNIKIKNFKILKDIDIALNNLTLIAGSNSSGKSSFIQSLLVFKENKENIIYIKNEEFLSKHFNRSQEELPKRNASFNGTYLNLGNEKLLLSQELSNEQMIFEISSGKNKMHIEINPKLEIDIIQDSNLDILDIFNDNCFSYLNTDRTSPALVFPFSETQIKKGLIGLKGEYTAHYLAENRHQSLKIAALKHPSSKTDQLLENVYQWMGEISNGVFISASLNPSTQSAKITYQYEYGDNITNDYSPLNVGFGLTYVLPVIVLLLKSKPGDFLIIENPESHLHPIGQSKIAELCAIAAHNGVQIIIESHSDHFLNGLRVATKNEIIAPEKSQIYFFEKEKDKLETTVHSIKIDKNGKINDWPKGFFDEWDKQLDKLLW